MGSEEPKPGPPAPSSEGQHMGLVHSQGERWEWETRSHVVGRKGLTLKVKVSLKAGFNVFFCTLVSYFFFLSGSRNTLTYGSEVPPMSKAGSSAAWRIPTVNWSGDRGVFRDTAQVHATDAKGSCPAQHETGLPVAQHPAPPTLLCHPGPTGRLISNTLPGQTPLLYLLS